MQCHNDSEAVLNGDFKTPSDEHAMRPSAYAFTNLNFSNIKLTFITENHNIPSPYQAI